MSILLLRQYDIGGLAANTTWLSPVIDTTRAPGIKKIAFVRSGFDSGASPAATAVIYACDADGAVLYPAFSGTNADAYLQSRQSTPLVAVHTSPYYRVRFTAGSNPVPAGAKVFVIGVDND